MQLQSLIQIDRIGDREPPLQRNDRQRKDRQVTGKVGEEPRCLTARTVLPVECEIKVLPYRVQIDTREQEQVQPHAHVGQCQVAHEEFEDRQFTPRERDKRTLHIK